MLANIWDQFLVIAKEETSSRVVETWFKSVSLNRWDTSQKVVYLQAPNSFVKDWIKNNYIPLFQMHLGRLLNVEAPKIIFIDSIEEKVNVPHTEIIPQDSERIIPGGARKTKQRRISKNAVLKKSRAH